MNTPLKEGRPMAADDFAERLEDELASPCPCGSGLSSLLCKEHRPMAKQPTPQGVEKVPCWGLDCDVMFEPWTNEWHCSDECYEKHRAAEGDKVRR